MSDREYEPSPQRQPRQGNLILPPSDKRDEMPVRRSRTKLPPIKPAGWLSYLALILITIGSFAPIFQSDLLWSSYDSVERSRYESMEDWTEAWTVQSIRGDDPLTLTSYFLETHLPLPPAVAHHAINLWLHVFAAILLLMVLDRLQLPAAFSASLIFALHPSVMQTIFWSGYRNELLALLVFLIALYFGVRNQNSRDFFWMILFSSLAFILHPGTLVLPLVLGLCIFYQSPKNNLKNYNRTLPLLCLALFIGVWAHADPSQSSSEEGILIALYGENMFFYLRQSLAPVELALFHPFEAKKGYSVGAQQSVLPFLLFVPLYVLIAINYKKQWARGVLMGLTAYLLLILYGLSQTGAFLDGRPAHEEHAQYIALPFLIAVVTCSAGAIARNMGSGGKILWGLGFTVFAFAQVAVTASFANSLSERAQMWMAMSEQWPDSWVPKLALIQSIQESGQDSEIIETTDMIDMLENVLQQQPKLIEERKLLARIFREERQNSNALREYKRILRESEPDDPFLEEAANFYDELGLSWDARNARERMSGPKL